VLFRFFVAIGMASLGRNNASLAERSPAMVMRVGVRLQQLQQFVYEL
jgi:hypothetical protein